MTRYIDTRSVHRLIGPNFPGGVPYLVQSLEEYLFKVKASGDSLPERLLSHNLSGQRNRLTCELAPIDADIVFTVDVATKKLNMELKDYRVHLQFARPILEHRVVLHLMINHPDRTTWSISVPLQALIKGFGDVEEGYQCYAHSIYLLNEEGGSKIEQKYYCGITSRNWLKRMSEHFADVRSGSNKTFHRAWREYQGHRNVVLCSELIVLNHSFGGAMGWEEMMVDRHMEAKCSLNMIPGGFKGLRMLHELGHLGRISNVSLEERDAALVEYVSQNPRTGIPNRLVAGLWEDDAYYERVITGRQNTLSADQVRRIRSLSQNGCSAESIATEIGARNVEQVRRVLSKQTYSRIKNL